MYAPLWRGQQDRQLLQLLEFVAHHRPQMMLKLPTSILFQMFASAAMHTALHQRSPVPVGCFNFDAFAADVMRRKFRFEPENGVCHISELRQE